MPTRRIRLAWFGKVLTTAVRRVISSFSRSGGFVLRIRVMRCGEGEVHEKVVSAVVDSSATCGKRSARPITSRGLV